MGELINKLKVRVNAKVNLTLDVLGTYGEGFHELDSIMASVGIFDIVECEKSDDVKVIMDGKVQGARNTAYKAWDICRTEYGIGGLNISITKGIPFQAGLGGSSADASAVLYCIGKIYGLTDEQLLTVARRVGSDVAFMLKGGVMRCGGKGDDLTALPFHDYALLIVKGSSGTNTGEVFRMFDCHKQISDNTARYVSGIESKADRLDSIANGLQHAGVMCNKDVSMAISTLSEFSSVVSMTGSGAGVFAILPNFECANDIASELKSRFTFVKACKVLDYGIKEI